MPFKTLAQACANVVNAAHFQSHVEIFARVHSDSKLHICRVLRELGGELLHIFIWKYFAFLSHSCSDIMLHALSSATHISQTDNYWLVALCYPVLLAYIHVYVYICPPQDKITQLFYMIIYYPITPSHRANLLLKPT